MNLYIHKHISFKSLDFYTYEKRLDSVYTRYNSYGHLFIESKI